VASEPLQLHQAATTAPQPQIPAPAQSQAQLQPAVPPQVAQAAPANDHGVMATLKGAVSTVERLPSRALGWFSDTVVPPRPPSDLPPRPFMKATM
jgi:hypothetical protein